MVISIHLIGLGLRCLLEDKILSRQKTFKSGGKKSVPIAIAQDAIKVLFFSHQMKIITASLNFRLVFFFPPFFYSTVMDCRKPSPDSREKQIFQTFWGLFFLCVWCCEIKRTRWDVDKLNIPLDWKEREREKRENPRLVNALNSWTVTI